MGINVPDYPEAISPNGTRFWLAGSTVVKIKPINSVQVLFVVEEPFLPELSDPVKGLRNR